MLSYHLKRYAIIGCPKCRRLFICRTDVKSFRCRNERCRYSIKLNWLRVKALRTGDDFEQLHATLQNMKMLKKVGKLWTRPT